MRKFAIISYYEPKDYLSTIMSIFEKKYKWKTTYFPLYMYCYDRNSKVDNYIDVFSEFMKKEKPDIVLWWFIDVSLSVFTRIKLENPKTFFVIYNHSDPVNLNKSFLDKCKLFNHVITVCKQNVGLYGIHTKNNYIDFCPPCYDNTLFRSYSPDEISFLDKSFSCDISFICDSLFLDQSEQVINRKSLIDIVGKHCDSMNLSFHLYGPDILNKFFPKYYKGEINYINLPSLFIMSKINIIPNVGYKKLLSMNNFNLMSVLACGGIVLLDNINGFDKFFDKSVFIYNKTNILEKINEILENNDLESVRENAIKISEKYTWEYFTDIIFTKYNHYAFDTRSYVKNHNLLEEKDFIYWIERFKKNIIDIPYRITIPPEFDLDNYKTLYNLDNTSDESVFIHWYNSGANRDFMKKRSMGESSLSGHDYNIPTTKIFDLFRAFNMIYLYQDIDKGLDILDDIASKNYNLKINDVLSKYIDISHCE